MGDLYLIDGTGIAYRAFFALDTWLKNSKGLTTNAILGTSRMMLKLLNDFVRKDKDSILFVMDKKTKTYRNELLESYKANRPKTPDEFIEQIPYILNMVEYMGINVTSADGYEADDIIATAAIKYKENYDNIYIVTSDKDMMQLIKENIFILRPEKGITDIVMYEENRVKEKMGVPPEKIIDLLSLMGDSADNIPGVKGIGIKTAQKLLNLYNDIEDIYKHIEELKGAVKTKLIAGKDMAYLSKRLVRLQYDAPLNYEKKDLIYTGFTDKFKEYLKELEFKRIIKELGFESEEKSETQENDYSKKVEYELFTSKDIKKLYKKIDKSSKISFDLETTSLIPNKAKVLGVALSPEPFIGYYLDLSNETEEKKKEVLTELSNRILKKDIIGQNIKYDISVLKNYDIHIDNVHFDTMIGAFLISPDSRRFNMDDLAEKYLNYKTTKYKEVMSGTLFSKTLKDINIESVKDYAGEDADITHRLYKVLYPKVNSSNLDRILKEVELPLIPVLAEMETNGVYFDTKYLKQLEGEFSKKVNQLMIDMERLAGYPFNPNSPKQVGELLYKKLGLKGKKKTKTGSYSTDAESLEYLKGQHPIIEKILENRKYQKLLSTYVIAIPKMVNEKTGRVHTSFNQTGTSTGRLSSSEPNLQNLPIREEEGGRIRKAVKPQTEDGVLLSADYSQIELRVLAHISKDKTLINAYKHGKDIHTITASKIFGISEEEVDSHARRVGKTVNFSIVYGVSGYGLAQRVGIGVAQAQTFINKYFELYKGVGEYQKSILEFAKKNGYVETLMGRKRFIKNIRANKNEVERMAINSPIQGTAADIMKLAMIKLYQTLPSYAKMILQVHDEIVIELPKNKLEEVKPILKDCMENAFKLDVPLEIDMKYGDYWMK